ASLDHDAGMTAQHLRLAGRQVELAAPDVDPHVVVGDHQVGIAREPEAGAVEQPGHPLVGDLHVDVFEMDDVAEVLGRTIEVALQGPCSEPFSGGHYSTRMEGRDWPVFTPRPSRRAAWRAARR